MKKLTSGSRTGDQGKITYLSKRSVAEVKAVEDAIDWSDVLRDLWRLPGR